MNAIDRAQLDREPLPAGEAVSLGVASTGSGWRLYWLVGVTRRYFGEVYASVRDATKAAAYLRGRTGL